MDERNDWEDEEKEGKRDERKEGMYEKVEVTFLQLDKRILVIDIWRFPTWYISWYLPPWLSI